MSTMASNRSPSPLSSRNCRNSGTNSTPRGSFNGNPFARPNALINPKSSNPQTPANTPATTDHAKRNSISRKSMSSLFQDGKENHKDSLRSPAKTGSKNFMAPTISAASKFTPSPRKKILGDMNDVTRSSIQFVDKDFDFKSEAPAFDQSVEQKEIVFENRAVHEVTVNSTDESTEMLSGCTTEDCDVVSIRPLCSTVTSPIIAPLDSEPHLPPYDPKKNFLSPRPQFLRYKPNPRIENFLNKEGSDGCGEDDVIRLESSFDLSENSSDTEVEVGDSVHGSSEDLSEKVLEEKQLDLKEENGSKSRGFPGSMTILFIFLMFLVACYSVSFTYSPPLDLPIYKDVGFSQIYHESLKFAGFAKESFHELVKILKSQLFPTQEISPVRFFNLTTSSVQEGLVFDRHIGTDYIQEMEEYEEEVSFEAELTEEEDFAEMEDDDDIDVGFAEMEVVNEQQNEIQNDDDGFAEAKSNLEDGSVSTKSDLEDGSVSKFEPISEARSEMEVNDLETATDLADSDGKSETMNSLSTKSLNGIILAGFSMVIIVVSAVRYMNKRRSNAKTPATIRAADDNTTCEESSSSSVGNEHKKKRSNNKRESMAFSSSDFSMGSSYGSFTTLERIPIKKKDEVMLTPIRRSSRLLKNQVS